MPITSANTITVVPIAARPLVVVPVGTGLQGAPGARGPAGPPAGAAAPYVQALASSVWTCPHNLARYPGVTVVDSLGNVITADVFYMDDNIVRISHGRAITGVVYFN